MTLNLQCYASFEHKDAAIGCSIYRLLTAVDYDMVSEFAVKLWKRFMICSLFLDPALC